MKSKEIIQLDDSLLIGKGRDRKCYQHPGDSNLCIKVALKKEKQSKREVSYLNYLERNARDLKHLCNFYGLVNTNYGEAYAFELALDNDNKIAPTLKDAIWSGAIGKQDAFEIVSQLKGYLTEQQICAYDLSPSNISIYPANNNKWNFKIIDGIGVANPNPFTARVAFLRNQLNHTALERLEKKTNKLFKYQKLGIKPKPKNRKNKIQIIFEKSIAVIVVMLGVLGAIYFELIEF